MGEKHREGCFELYCTVSQQNAFRVKVKEF
jgi:hypothetical protein